jgi:hypothetical protein
MAWSATLSSVADIHVPKLEGHGGGKSIFVLGLEVALISVGVFLGLMGEQWREGRHHRELAEQALRRFRTEILENRKSVADVKDYHAQLFAALKKQFDLPTDKRSMAGIRFEGFRPASFDHAAWDLAIATQSLAYLDSDLALALSNVYNLQTTVTGQTQGLLQAMYITPPVEDRNTVTFMGAVLVYYGDMNIYEPRLLQLYDAVLSRIDTALGEKSKIR